MADPAATTTVLAASGQGAEHARRYELARQAATGGAADGWRHGLGVLAAKGVAYWMGTWATRSATGPPPSTAPTSQAELPLSTTTRSLSAHQSEGGEPASSACRSLLAPAVEAVVAVLAQMTLAHARSHIQKGPCP